MKYIILVLLFICLYINGISSTNHAECGESPTKKYAELAKAIGKFKKFNSIMKIKKVLNWEKFRLEQTAAD